MIFHPTMRNITQYLDKGLSPEQGLKLEKHFQKCERCSKKIELLRISQRNVKPKESKSNSMVTQIMGNIQKRKWNVNSPMVGEIKSMVGQEVFIRRNGNQDIISAFPGCGLRKGDTVVTKGGSKALVEWRDGSWIYVNEGTELDIQTMPYPLNLRMGEIFSMMKPQSETFEIWTPSAVLSVLGTDFDAEVNKKNQTILRVLKGKVGYKNKSGEVVVNKNQQVEAEEYSKPEVRNIQQKETMGQWMSSLNQETNGKGDNMKKVLVLIIVVLVLAVGYLSYKSYFAPGGGSQPSVKGGAAPLPGNGDTLLSKEPKFIDLGEMKVIGVGINTDTQKVHNDAPGLWKTFIPQSYTLQGRANPNQLLAIYNFDSTTITNPVKVFTYTLGCEVNNTDNVPNGMSVVTLPASKYAVFTHKGGTSRMQDSYSYIYQIWMPNSGHRMASFNNFETFDRQRFFGLPNPDHNPNTEIDIYIPVE